MPNEVVPLKNSTLATVPSESEALACSVTLAGAANPVLFAGLVILTVGGLFWVAACTVTDPVINGWILQ